MAEQFLELVGYYVGLAAMLFLTEVAKSLGVNVGIIITGLVIVVGAIVLNVIHGMVPNFIRRRYPDPVKLIGLIGVFVCLVGWWKNNILEGNVQLFLHISNGNASLETLQVIAVVPSGIHWLYQGEGLKGRFWRNLACFAILADFLFCLTGMSLNWGYEPSDILSESIWKSGGMIFQIALGSGIGEAFSLHWITTEYKAMIKAAMPKAEKTIKVG